MKHRLLPYQEHAVALREQRARHRAEAPPGCKCEVCASPAELRALLQRKLESNPGYGQEVPF